jgi:predicted nucleotidyltransferase
MSVLPATVPVPTIDVRRRVPDEAIAEVIRHIAERYQPERLILFGSYAYGDPRPESDVDLLVVMNTDLRESEQAVQILQSVEHHFGLDLIVRTPASLERRLALGDPFLREIVERGKVVYERSGP